MYIKKDMFAYFLAKKGISKKEACKELKLSVNTVNNWLHRKVKTPVWKAIYVAEYLNADLEMVFQKA